MHMSLVGMGFLALLDKARIPLFHISVLLRRDKPILMREDRSILIREDSSVLMREDRPVLCSECFAAKQG